MRLTIRIGWVALSLFVPSAVHAQAYCALRDPVREIYALYPEATSYRSLVRTIGEEARGEVAKELRFELHFSELGQHTLYVALKDGGPIGLVHARSEQSQWGLVEIAWALNLDLQVVDFRFQRCRAPECAAIGDAAFRAQLKGKGVAELRALLSSDNRGVNPVMLTLPDGSDDLATAVLRSGLKTIVVTGVAWAEDLGRLRAVFSGPVPEASGDGWR